MTSIPIKEAVNNQHGNLSKILFGKAAEYPKIYYFQLKFIYSEKATKFCEIFTLLLTDTTYDKSKVKISWPSQNI